MLRLWRDRPRLEIAHEFEEYAVRVDGMNDPTCVCISTRATRCHLERGTAHPAPQVFSRPAQHRAR